MKKNEKGKRAGKNKKKETGKCINFIDYIHHDTCRVYDGILEEKKIANSYL